MRNLFQYLAIFLSLQIPAQVWAISCSDLQRDLITIQGLLDNTRPVECSEDVQRNCCNPDDPNSCRTMDEARTNYNEALAKLTIIEGLIAIGQSLEDSHNSLRNIEPAEVDQAVDDIDAFFRTFDRANLLNLSMELTTGTPRAESDSPNTPGVGDRSIWDGYSGTTISDLRDYLANQCGAGTSFANFCREYHELLAEEDEEANTEIWETLQGFALSNNQILSSDRNSQFANYRQYLQVNIEGAAPISVSSEAFMERLQPVTRLQDLLENYRSGNRSPELTQQIVAVSREVDSLDINFDQSEELPVRFQRFAANHLQKTLTKIRSASGVFLNINDTLHNIGVARNTINIDLDSTQTNTASEAETFVSRSMSSYCNDDESAIACIERACNSTGSISDTCPSTAETQAFHAVDINALHRRIKNMRRAEKMSEALGSLRDCMNRQLPAIRECLTSEIERLDLGIDSQNLPSALNQARAQLADAQEILNHNASSDNIRHLETLKAMALVQMQQNGCGQTPKHTLDMTSVCGSENLLTHSRNFVEFQEDLGATLLSYNNEIMQSLYRDQQRTANYISLRDDLIEDCSENPNPAYANLCAHLSSQRDSEEIEIPIHVDPIVRRHLEGSGDRSTFDDSVRTTAIWGGLGRVAVMGATQGLGAAIQVQQTENYLNSWRAQSEQNAYWNEYYRNNQYTTNNNMNWGYNYWSPNYVGNFQYQTSNQIYYQHVNHNFNQFTFAPTQVASNVIFSAPLTSPVVPAVNPPPIGNQFNFDFNI